jgi:hypothetical protein
MPAFVLTPRLKDGLATGKTAGLVTATAVEWVPQAIWAVDWESWPTTMFRRRRWRLNAGRDTRGADAEPGRVQSVNWTDLRTFRKVA